MNRYVWNSNSHNKLHIGGNKARNDVIFFSLESGYIELPFYNSNIVIIKILALIFNIVSFPFLIKKNSTLLIQYPYNIGQHIILRIFKKILGIKVICVVHDLESIRFSDKKALRLEKKYLNCTDVLITLNELFSNYIKENIKNKTMFAMNMWDYKITNQSINIDLKNGVLIAGNFSNGKSKYVEDLSKINGVNFFLMGKKNSHNLPHNIEYLGEFNAGTPPRIVNGVALIWDGDNVESCTGNYGNYLKYNIPHKSSLYLALGLPVITWKKSFISTFILEENIGCSVSSLHEITPELIKNLIYLQEKDNFSLLQEKVKNGFFIKSALKKAELSL